MDNLRVDQYVETAITFKHILKKGVVLDLSQNIDTTM